MWHGGVVWGIRWHLGVVSGGELVLVLIVGGDMAYALETAAGDSGDGSDVAYGVGSCGDMVVGLDENALAWPVWAFARAMAGMAMTAGGGWWW